MSATDRAAPRTSPAARSAEKSSPAGPGHGWTVLGLVIVVGLAAAGRQLSESMPALAAGTPLSGVVAAIEYPVYAIALGFAGNAVLSLARVRERMAAAFRTEFFIKIGLVLLGATVSFAVLVRAAGPAVLQAIVLITVVFGATWWFAGALGLDDRLRALLASALAICGVSAAVAAAGAVQARKEQLAYTAALVITFAVPSIFLLPWLADLMELSPAVTGAWIGGNIDTTAAVTAAGEVAGEQPLQIASIVKVTQNALLGVVAVLLTIWFSLRTAQDGGSAAEGQRGGRASLALIWDRFPKFVLGFLITSAIATVSVETIPAEVLEPRLDAAKELQTWALTLAFVSIGLEFNASSIREAGVRPILVFFVATVVNLVVGLLLALVLFQGFTF